MKKRTKPAKDSNRPAGRRLQSSQADRVRLTDDVALELLAPLKKKQSSELTEPSAEAIERYCAVPLLYDATTDTPSLHGEIVYDSWAHAPVVSVRDSVDGHVRRLKLKAGRVTFEIVAERRDNRWEFVARATVGRHVANQFVLTVGRRKLLPQSGGFYLWNSATVPRTVRLESFEQNVVFEKLAWR